MTDYTKLDAYPQLNLIKGSGASYEQGFCVMQAVAWFAGEAHIDAPQCACPVLGAFAIRLNDRLPDDKRQILRTLIAPLTSTRSNEHEQLRAEYIVRRVSKEIVASLFDKRWPDHAAAIRSAQTMVELKQVMMGAKAAAYAYAYASAAAYAYASAAADAYAYDAAYAGACAAASASAAADAASAYARSKTHDIMIEILRGAIALGPNGGEDLTPFAERIHELHARGYADATA